jgi:RNA polymerase sigma-70 factor (ECF subfamily)
MDETYTDLDDPAAEPWEASRVAWPSVSLPLTVFARHLRGRLPENVTYSREALASLACVDLYLSCACMYRAPHALETLDRVFLAQVAAFVRRVDASAAFADEVRQLLREKLFVGDGERAAKIGEYSGRGPLLAWLRVAALRTALNLRRDRGVVSEDLSEGAAMVDFQDPELDMIKERYRELFQRAVVDAFAELPSDQRSVMRLHLVAGLTTAEIGKMFRVNQSTVVRWLAAARTTVRDRTRERLQDLLQLSASEFESLVGLMLSRMDLSLTMALQSHGV